MGIIKERFRLKAESANAEIKDLLKDHGNKKIGEVTLSQIYQGMRGITGLVSETSLLDAQEGIRFRGYSIPELQEKLPKVHPNGEPLPEGLFYLMLIGELPGEEDVQHVTNVWQRRSHVPTHVFKAIDALPLSTHPMTMFVVGVMALQTESDFAREYAKGINKKDYWNPVYDDVMDLIARLPRIAAYIYRRKYKNKEHIEPDGLLDWAGNLAHMMGFEDESFKELMRLYMTIHADHEGGNVSAHATHLVGSALSDPYLSYAAGMNGLAGPLHGLANQEVIKWIFEMQKELGTDNPSKEQIEEYVKRTIADGKVVPGYGHAVLRKTDPRFTAQMEFGKKHMPDDKLVNTVWKIYETVPPILQSMGKIKNPWPNVDAHSGALLVHYGLVEYEFYTVLFAVSRALGVLANLCWDRALGFPLERPKSVTTNAIKRWLKGEDEIWD
ncbi:MAG: citrate (Si)-synthase, eukaryotic [Hydrotalea flava]|uniref:citrate (Si)-synthase, eukaryotic n=1 Tax=Hydrotalea TaxID=1004300 RepID=UPI00094212E9|nr:MULTISPECIES: citrate (Si)-synthase, eukaryotic [Hydrotalea]MBY0348973.1 citrate (Si)-synthase, eukaryotic [Hydrotalea flava]NIM35170.1 citrate (Si)-synthase, eukaryotic [Hydrotalea flava]NIM37991.1 citrate (Si)-synthase, eukaryotic [Hydrotalea flava]NIN03160.1 citrate (Si)-synthase, eukaryotic [Hydrotalea flava]NIN14850.1 citrate (Si)-synthase, eukaryotic [Hydrotalea flava]